MAESKDPATEHPHEVRPVYVPVRQGHPRFNLLVLLVLVGVFIAIALIEAQRLQF